MLSPMTQDQQRQAPPEAFHRLPVFPLPQAVLFPGVVMPLHLFEPRYRALAEHCINGDKTLALASLQPGYEADYEGRPPIFPIAGVGEIVAHRRLPDGRWNIALRGVCRAELVHELPPDEPFRIVRARRLREVERHEDVVAADRLRSVALQLTAAVPGAKDQLGTLLKEARSPSATSDALAALFVESFGARRGLLEELDVARRMERLESLMAELLLDISMADAGERSLN